jgi:uncharacterized protein with PIN domain
MSEREDMIRRLDKMELRPRASRQEVLETVASMQIRTQKEGTCSYCGGEMERLAIEHDFPERDEIVTQCAECGRIEGGV